MPLMHYVDDGIFMWTEFGSGAINIRFDERFVMETSSGGYVDRLTKKQFKKLVDYKGVKWLFKEE